MIILVLLFLLFPIGTIPICIYLLVKNKFESRGLSAMLAIALGLLAYAYIPIKEMDLYKHYQSTVSFDGNFQAYLEYVRIKGSHLSYYLFYLSSLVGAYNLVSLLFVSLSYYFNFRFIRLCASRGAVNYEMLIAMVLLLFTVHSYPVAISTLRQPLAFSMFAYAILYDDVFKKRNWICLIIPVFLHISILPILGIYAVLFLWEKGKLWFAFFGGFGAILIGLMWGRIYSALFSGGLLESKVQGYGQISSFADESMVYTQIMVAMTLVFAVLMLFRLHALKRLAPLMKGSLFVRFALLYVVLIIIVVPYPVYFYRLGSYTPFFILPLVGVAMKGVKDISYYTMLSIGVVTVAFAARLQYANIGGYYFRPEVFYQNVVSILVNLKNCFL